MATLVEMRTVARQKADMEDTTFITNTELNGYINSAIKELYDLILTTYGDDYYLEEYNFTTSSGTEEYALPTDFYKLRGVDVQINGNTWSTLRKYQFSERNKYQLNGSWSLLGVSSIRYRLRANNIKFAPAPDGNLTARLWYAPKFEDLTVDAEEFDGINGWEEYVEVDAAIQMLTKEESDTTVLERRKANLVQRILESAPRDSGEPETIQETQQLDGETFLYGFSDS